MNPKTIYSRATDVRRAGSFAEITPIESHPTFRSRSNKTYALNHTKASHIPSDISSFGARILRETKKAGGNIGDRWKYS